MKLGEGGIGISESQRKLTRQDVVVVPRGVFEMLDAVLQFDLRILRGTHANGCIRAREVLASGYSAMCHAGDFFVESKVWQNKWCATSLISRRALRSLGPAPAVTVAIACRASAKPMPESPGTASQTPPSDDRGTKQRTIAPKTSPVLLTLMGVVTASRWEPFPTGD